MRLIDADKFYAELKERSDAALKWYNEETDEENKARAEQAFTTFCEVKLTLDKQPTIDAVPVVKCKDCILGEKVGDSSVMCKLIDMRVISNGYCECGERKSETY